MSRVVGETGSLKTSQLRALERLSRRQAAPEQVIGPEMARGMCELSAELKRQLGVLLHRSGEVELLMVGDRERIVIPALAGIRCAGGRLRGLRCIHTHPAGGGPSEEDLLDMVCLRLDLMAVLTMTREGLPDQLHVAHLLPEAEAGRDYRLLPPVHPAASRIHCLELVQALEQEFTRRRPVREVDRGRDRAILVSVTSRNRHEAADSLTELAELARAAGVLVQDSLLQQRRQVHPRFLLGKGKLAELMLLALRHDANLLIFDQELNPSQVRSITEHTDLRVIDRTQLILDIFASRALSREGKLQIEMAQLKYMLPRLASRDDSLSRLTGGIGARGPGETRLEIDRRRIKDRLARLARELTTVGRERYHRRGRRRKGEVPVISLVGYTNAGKSTLLNTLTHSRVVAEDQLFATLDPTSRRLRFPREMEVILTDTVGFIRQLPQELLQAFASTLEELHEADLLLHVIDISNPAWEEQAEVVDQLLRELGLEEIPCLRVLNKCDRLDAEGRTRLAHLSGVPVSALDESSLTPLLLKAQEVLLLNFSLDGTRQDLAVAGDSGADDESLRD
ncbi:MAG: GTPase HflX [Desulfobulbaceae bacterium A2]|nr:MAG: GTPase HflX [Desulfobulbaceae bacterium A2]